jgi:Chaperone of endosialidase
MSFRQFGGLNYSAKNNIITNQFSNSGNLGITDTLGQPNSKIVSQSHIDMSANSVLHIGKLYFMDGTVQATASSNAAVATNFPSGIIISGGNIKITSTNSGNITGANLITANTVNATTFNGTNFNGGTFNGNFYGNLIGGSAGSVVYQSDSNVTTFSNEGTDGYFLKCKGTTPTWVSVAGSLDLDSVLGYGNSAGSHSINMNNNPITNVTDIQTSTINYGGNLVTIGGSATFASAVGINGTLGVTGSATFASAVGINGTLGVTGSATFASAVGINGTLGVTGSATFASAVGINGTLGVTGSATFANAVGINGTLGVTGSATFASAVGINGTLGVTGSATFATTSTVNVLNTTDASNSTSGAIVVAGGIGVAKSVSAGLFRGPTGLTSTPQFAGGATGSIPYQTNASATTFLTGATTNGSILAYDTTVNAPKWVAPNATTITTTDTDTTGPAPPPISAGTPVFPVMTTGLGSGQYPYIDKNTTPFSYTPSSGTLTVPAVMDTNIGNTSFNLLNIPTTITFGGAATAINIGSGSTGTLTINNPTIATSQTTTPVNLLNTNAQNINFAGSATAINIGSGSTGTLTINNPTIATSQTTTPVNLLNTNAQNINFGGAASAITMGATTGTLTIRNPTIATTQTSVNLLNTNAQTINFGGAATAISIGKPDPTGKVTINSTQAATTATSAALVINGGIGVGYDSYFGTGVLAVNQLKVATSGIALGYQAGIAQGYNAVAIGFQSGFSGQGLKAISIGFQAGFSGQGDSAVAIGNNAGGTGQGQNSVAIGESCGGTNQGLQAVAIGFQAGSSGQGLNAVAIGIQAGNTYQGQNAVAIGFKAGQTNQGGSAIAIGNNSGVTGQGGSAVAIGSNSGQTAQGLNAIAIGINSGSSGQGQNAVAIGNNSGKTAQGQNAVAIGNYTGFTSQGMFAVAIGDSAGGTGQGMFAVAIGDSAGGTGQGQYSVAIGSSAGFNGQGENAIAIGKKAGATAQGKNSIVINATGSILNCATQSAFCVAPIRNTQTLSNILAYTSSSEIIVLPSGSDGEVLTYNGTSGPTWESITNITIHTTSLNQDYYPTFVSDTSGYLPLYVGADMKFNPSTSSFTLSGGSNVDINSTNGNGVSLNLSYGGAFISQDLMVYGGNIYGPNGGTLNIGPSASGTINIGDTSGNTSAVNIGGSINFKQNSSGGTQVIEWLNNSGTVLGLIYSSTLNNEFAIDMESTLTNGFKIKLTSSDIFTVSTAGACTATSFTSTSDYRIKENTKLLDNTFSIDNLKPVTYRNKLTEKQDIGFIAHEVQEEFPYLVTGEKDGENMQSLNYIGLIGVLVKEIQDLKKRVSILENK